MQALFVFLLRECTAESGGFVRRFRYGNEQKIFCKPRK